MYAADTIKALYAFSDCEVPISPNLTVIRDNQPVVLSVDEVLEYNTKKLVRDLEKELLIDRDRLSEKLHAHLLEQIFIEERIYKRIEECKTFGAVIETVDKGLAPFLDRLVRNITRDDIERLLEIKIRRISRYDIDRKQKEINEVRSRMRQVEKDLTDMNGFTIRYIDSILERYGKEYPRRTEIDTFSEVEARDVALSNLIVGYDRENGFLGHQVRTTTDISIACSEYDKLLLIFTNGMYKVVNVADKIFVGSNLCWVGKVQDSQLFNMIYRNGRENVCYVKRFRSPKFILEKEYRLFDEHSRSEILYLALGEGHIVRVRFAPSRRAKSNFQDLALDEYLVKSPAAIGKRISTRVVRKITEQGAGVAGDDENSPPALFPANK